MNFMFNFGWKYGVSNCTNFRASISRMNSKTLTFNQILQERQSMKIGYKNNKHIIITIPETHGHNNPWKTSISNQYEICIKI